MIPKRPRKMNIAYPFVSQGRICQLISLGVYHNLRLNSKSKPKALQKKSSLSQGNMKWDLL